MQNFYSRISPFAIVVAAAIFVASSVSLASETTWDSNLSVDPSGNRNPYGLTDSDLRASVARGQIYASQYPVETTGLVLPARPALKVLDLEPGEPFFRTLRFFLSLTRPFDRSFRGFWNWVGLNDAPVDPRVVVPTGLPAQYPYGVSFVHKNGTLGVTMGCVACHSSSLFGKTVFGMTTRFSRADEFFLIAKQTFPHIGANTLRILGANRGERDMYREVRRNLRSIQLKKPEALGLDTSLAVVAKSLALRAPDPWATRGEAYSRRPRPTALDEFVPDSKPAVWWNVKYKNRWLSDGSVLSGNPLLTVLLWNEIGRGSDLREFEAWLDRNPEKVQDLTNAVYNSQAPRWREFMPSAMSISVERAKRGESLFNQNCASCHGVYEKAWSLGETEFREWSGGRPGAALVDTIRTIYHERTPVVEVGTDPQRRLSARALAEGLNPLAISRKFGIVNEEQKGYVPPPLEGIWARYPYLHNNSIPNLCVLMTPPEQRPQVYYSGAAIDPARDYDADCLGYPIQGKTPAAWKTAAHRFDSSRKGLSNGGHYDGIFRKNGVERYSQEEKRDLREFLKTL